MMKFKGGVELGCLWLRLETLIRGWVWLWSVWYLGNWLLAR